MELLSKLDQELDQLKSTEKNAIEQYSFADRRLRLVKAEIEHLYNQIELLKKGQPTDIRLEPED